MRALKVVLSAVCFTGAWMLLIAAPSWAHDSGAIQGSVERDNGKGIGGVTVVLSEMGRVEITDGNGNFRFASVPAG